jgi:hypothetical protein
MYRTHGMRNSPENEAWHAMKQRCNNPKSQAYKNYGGRGIQVCPEWASFEAFYRDMGPRPSPKHSLERIDNERGYEAGNCRWATLIEQHQNTRYSRFLEFGGETKACAEWCRELGIKPSTLCDRLKRGWSDEMALGYR